MIEAERAMLHDMVNALNELAEKHPSVHADMFCVMLMSELVRTARKHPSKEVLLAKLDALWVSLLEDHPTRKIEPR